MRIATWNLEQRWSDAHRRVLDDVNCNVLLLTEVPAKTRLQGYCAHLSAAVIGAEVHWAGILSRWQIEMHADPHPASVVAETGGILFGCSVLPWPLTGPVAPWEGDDHPSRMRVALDAVSAALVGSSVVWGGDWNQPLAGNLTGFTRGAQEAVLKTVDDLGLVVPTAMLPGRPAGQASIDHIAVPADWSVSRRRRQRVLGGTGIRPVPMEVDATRSR